MKNLLHKIASWVVLPIWLTTTLQSCTSYSTHFNERQPIDIADVKDIKKGKACTKNLFGGINFPLIGNIAIKLTGDQSVVTALQDGRITEVYSVDSSVIHYLFYSKKCTIVYGQ
ncbi:MAG: hypothetical protein O3B09_01405 [Proteobacteria bacterium]|nr:hypothetical protein [Pseudomonadota bacterium]